MHEHKICPAVWFSGFFGLGTVVHLVRSILRFPLVVGAFEVPLALSLLLTVLLGGLSIALLWVGLRRPCCKEE
jgi:hypothetical protein